MANKSSLTRIGWREMASLPQLGIPRIKLKVDTGARTSALHAVKVHAIWRDGKPWVQFTVHPHQKNIADTVVCECEILDRRTVRNSGGHEEDRFVILTSIRLGKETWPIELTLTNRKDMGFRMLLGREAVRGRFLVDPGKSFLVGKKKKKKS